MKEDLYIHINDYRYDLPDGRIARFPLAKRDLSRLLLYDRGEITHHRFNDLPGLLPGNSRLVFNDTRVIQARLRFHKPTGARIEILCVTPHLPSDHHRALESNGSCTWNCMVGNAKKWKGGTLWQKVNVEGTIITLEARLTEGGTEDFLV